MYVWLRLARGLWGRKPKAKPTLESGTRMAFRVGVGDIDLNGHLNNARYFAVMDVARYNMVRQAGLWAVVQKNGWYPVVAQQAIRFRRSIAFGHRFEVATRVVGWDAKSMVIEQRFLTKGKGRAEEECAVGVVRAVFLSKEGKVPADEVMRAAGFVEASPNVPGWMSAWVSQPSA